MDNIHSGEFYPVLRKDMETRDKGMESDNGENPKKSVENYDLRELFCW